VFWRDIPVDFLQLDSAVLVFRAILVSGGSGIKDGLYNVSSRRGTKSLIYAQETFGPTSGMKTKVIDVIDTLNKLGSLYNFHLELKHIQPILG
jgi:hypothetical protein